MVKAGREAEEKDKSSQGTSLLKGLGPFLKL
jgi:hypothetical protein